MVLRSASMAQWLEVASGRRFRAKPGDKFKYRYSTDVWEPEWGIVPEEKGRLIRRMARGQGMLAAVEVRPAAAQGHGGEASRGGGGRRWLGRAGRRGGGHRGIAPGLRRHAGGDRAGWTSLGLQPGLRGALVGGLVDVLEGSNGFKRQETPANGWNSRQMSWKTSHEEKNFEVEWDAELYGELLSTGGGKERMARRGLQTFAPLVWRLKSLKFLLFFLKKYITF